MFANGKCIVLICDITIWFVLGIYYIKSSPLLQHSKSKYMSPYHISHLSFASSAPHFLFPYVLNNSYLACFKTCAEKSYSYLSKSSFLKLGLIPIPQGASLVISPSRLWKNHYCGRFINICCQLSDRPTVKTHHSPRKNSPSVDTLSPYISRFFIALLHQTATDYLSWRLQCWHIHRCHQFVVSAFFSIILMKKSVTIANIFILLLVGPHRQLDQKSCLDLPQWQK